MTLYGWDLSNHDWERHRVSLADAKKAGISLVTHKASEGTGYSDPYFDDFCHQLRSVAFPVAGSYHVLNHGLNVSTQTDLWFSRVTACYPEWKKHPCWIWQIDAEPLDGYAAPTKAEILACASRLVHRYGVAPEAIIIYGPDWVYNEKLTGVPYKLWASSYVNGYGTFKSLYPGDRSSRWNQYSGHVPTILQYTSSSVIGAQHTCDANAIRVTSAAALQALFKKPKPVAPAVKPTRKRPDMIVVRIDPATVPKGSEWPGYVTFNGADVRHIHATEAKDSNVNNICKALGQTSVEDIGYQQYLEWKAGK